MSELTVINFDCSLSFPDQPVGVWMHQHSYGIEPQPMTEFNFTSQQAYRLSIGQGRMRLTSSLNQQR